MPRPLVRTFSNVLLIMMPFTAQQTGFEPIGTAQPGAIVQGLSGLFDRAGRGLDGPADEDDPIRQRMPVDDLETEVLKLNRERALIAAENQLLTDIVCRDAAGASGRLLRRLIPHSANGFAALIGVRDTELNPLATRGTAVALDVALTTASQELNRLLHEPLLVRKVHPNAGPAALLTKSAEAESAAVNRQFPSESHPNHELYLIPIHDEDHLVAILVTTSLWPGGLKLYEQAATLRRLCQSVVRRLADEQRLKEHEDELRLMREMLALKSIMDRAIEQPLEVLGEFAYRLCTTAGMDRAALYLAPRRDGDKLEPVVNAGTPLPLTLTNEWSRHEKLLASANLDSACGATFDQAQLQAMNITTLWRSAIVWPLVTVDRRMGTLVLSGQQADPVAAQTTRLIQWSADVLAQTLRRIYSDAVIRRQARHDGLTDLANRRTFDTLLAGEIDRVRLGLSEECSLLLLDLDRFKQINDRYGHQAGDEVLRLTAQLLREQVSKMRVGERSLLARYGGEELAVLLPGVGTSGALRIAEEIRVNLERMRIAFGEHRLNVTVSIGVATCPRHGLKSADLISATDAALYRAKSEGRNRVCVPSDTGK